MIDVKTKTKPYLACTLVFVLIAASAGGPRGYRLGAVDTNGDQQVDVLDVQLVVAQVLSGASQDGRADVNGDGRVDILDLQRILSQASQADAPEPETPGQSNPEAAFAANRSFPPPLMLSGRRSLPFREEGCRDTSNVARRERVAAIPREVERYLFTLTPHAPPAGHGLGLRAEA